MKLVDAARFAVRTRSGLQSLEDLTGRTVVSTRGTTNIRTVQAVSEERLLKMKIVEADDHAAAFAMVSTGQADAFAMDDEMRRLIFTGELQQLYNKWFMSPIPPRGINLELPMSFMLKESFKFPSDKVGDLAN